MPKLTIDGKEVEVPKGTRIIEAAKKTNIDIPFYCYHPGLSIAGNCRMCLVEIEKMPKLQISCHLEAQDGMVVKTNTPKVLATRQHVLEFLLVNHPLDCPVCDQAGECWLQDYYMRYGIYDSRVSEDKVKKPKAVPIGSTVMLDAERCILCSRCVRFCDEVSKTSELGIVNRGDHSEIQVFPGKEVNNPYSGNIVDICPVGALTDRDFRFKIRVWYLKSEDSVCNGCARGCNISMQYNLDRPHHSKGERVKRLKPRYNEQVNKWWMCDEGRYGYKFHDQNRILRPSKRSNGSFQETGWGEILPEVIQNLQNAKQKIGVFISPQLSNEEIFLAKKLFQEGLKLKNIFLVSPNLPGFQDDFLIRADKNPNSKGAEFLGLTYNESAVKGFFNACEKGEVEGIVVFGQDLLTLHGAHLAGSGFKHLKWSLFIGSNHNLMSEYASHVLPAATYAEKEGTFTNCESRTQKFNKALDPLGEARPEYQILIHLAKHLGIHFHYDRPEEIFNELAGKTETFGGLNYEKLNEGTTNVRKFAAPLIPDLVQDAGLIFVETKE
ncbi:MAG: (2Fe-2S)-binding protein [Candidatus Omnitrophica bacterium]|nr:(2Fe-2S)-binding protein [Candidatus Omnitrophota bacterium]